MGTMDKMQQMYYISLGFLAMWFVFGIPMSFYVRGQTMDVASKGTYAW